MGFGLASVLRAHNASPAEYPMYRRIADCNMFTFLQKLLEMVKVRLLILLSIDLNNGILGILRDSAIWLATVKS